MYCRFQVIVTSDITRRWLPRQLPGSRRIQSCGIE